MNKKMYAIVFVKYLDDQFFGHIVPQRRFEIREDAFRYIDYLKKVSNNIAYLIFKRYCIGSVENGDFCEFKLGWNMPKYISENISIEELKIIYWMCFHRYCSYMKFTSQEINYDASFKFKVI